MNNLSKRLDKLEDPDFISGLFAIHGDTIVDRANDLLTAAERKAIADFIRREDNTPTVAEAKAWLKLANDPTAHRAMLLQEAEFRVGMWSRLEGICRQVAGTE